MSRSWSIGVMLGVVLGLIACCGERECKKKTVLIRHATLPNRDGDLPPCPDFLFEGLPIGVCPKAPCVCMSLPQPTGWGERSFEVHFRAEVNVEEAHEIVRGYLRAMVTGQEPIWRYYRVTLCSDAPWSVKEAIERANSHPLVRFAAEVLRGTFR